MGCTQSKIENEEAVTRCKDRKQLMKESVSARNAFAAAHSSYAMSLKNTGAALSDYAHGEVLQPPNSNPSDPSSMSSSSAIISNSTASASSALPAASSSQFDATLPPPPPPLPNFPASPLQRAASMPEFKISKASETKKKHEETIVEEENEEDVDAYENSESLKRRSKRSGSSHRGSQLPNGEVVMGGEQTPPPPEHKDSTWDYFFFSGMENMPGPTLTEEVVEDKEKVYDEMPKRGPVIDEMPKRGPVIDEMPRRVPVIDDDLMAEKNSKVPSQAFEEIPKRGVVEDVAEVAVPPPPSGEMVAKNVRKVKQAVVGGMEGRREKTLGSANVLQVFIDLDDHFLKASESAHEVSKMLEATRLHYHSNFADNRGHIDHSARVMRVITWNRSFRGLSNPDDGKDDFDSEEHETHATVLDKLLAWEKKLYDEVKAGELMKFDYQRKVAFLNKQKKRGTSDALEKARAAVSHLHTRYIVDMQSMDSTVSEINRLRDEQLYPKLVALVDGMATMWDTMRVHHESQSKIVYHLKSLDISHSPKETSEHHHERTIQLWAVVQEWHLQFEKLVNHQKEYIKSLNHWLKLNLIPIESSLKERVSSPPRVQSPPIQSLLRVWHDYLDKIPDGHAKSAIANFAALMNSIVQHQEDEMKLKVKCEETRKELSRKTRQFEDWYTKYMQRKTPEELDPERTEDVGLDEAVAERKFAVDVLKKRLEEEEEAYQKQCLQVREKSLFSLKSHLPELFRSLSDFSLACSEMYRNLRSVAKHRNAEGERL